MKKQIYFLVSLFALIGFSSNVMGQTSPDQITGVNAPKTYKVNYGGTTPAHLPDHVGNTYTWNVYTWDGSSDFGDQAWGATTAASSAFTFGSGTAGTGEVNAYSKQITWKTSGSYVVEVVESGDGTGCKTKRRFGVRVIELDLLVTTLREDGTDEIQNNVTECNTAEGKVWTNSDNTDLNGTGVDPALGTTVYKYKIQLFTKDGGSASDNIASTFPDATWQFNPTVTNTTPTGGLVSWNYSTGATGAVNSAISVAKATSEVILTLTLKNVAGDEALKYINSLTVANTSVKIDLLGGSTFADGTEAATTAHSNVGKQITVNPIPNTSKISVE